MLISSENTELQFYKNALDKPRIRTLEKQPELKQDSPFYPCKTELKGKGRIRAAVSGTVTLSTALNRARAQEHSWSRDDEDKQI
ncbi:hypothetical protein IHE44_0007966 [Lamprotornis superbus]|uniref:Uncharacterized protein n=1 Tax=Lamprotornis superbus TaxID=245042 RepID=A0A835NQ39_9PASS|nr:hypothetical protein IHE44_0007966 [Lamprotornis superbus]